MPKIFVLPEHIASQIAAGEVVERPASVVKELVENSIDAGATKIIINVEEGCRRIRVSDNGFGMATEDAALAFQRHATSKLATANDLWNLNTLGFRGEALPSIAAISKLSCLTRTMDNTIGTEIISKDGNMKVSETGCALGTVIEVNDLFYNVPARLSFLKKAATEFGHILEIVQSLAITYPAIAFELSSDKIVRLSTRGSGSLDEAVREAQHFSGDETLIKIQAADQTLELKIEARLAKPIYFRGDRKGILTIVNGRPVRCPLTYKALDYAYADLIPRGRYPLAVIHLSLRAGDLDVNIHPTKKEVRYAHGNEVYAFVQRQIVRALTDHHSIQEIDLPAPGEQPNFAFPNATEGTDRYRSLDKSHEDQYVSQTKLFSGPGRSVHRQYREPLSTGNREGSTYVYSASVLDQPSLKEATEDNYSSTLSALPLDWRIAGYVHNTYILLETMDGLSIVEQHIAHERVLYEKLHAKREKAEKQPEFMQKLLISSPLQLTETQVQTLKENIDGLREIGFDFEMEETGDQCTQVPIELAHKEYTTIIQEILQALAEDTKKDAELDIVKSVACQAAIKNGMPLSPEQILELLSSWYHTPRHDTCPHGRPIQLKFSKDKLFQLFHPK